MVYVIIIVVIIALIVAYLYYAKRSGKGHLDKAYDLFMRGTAIYVTRLYINQYGEEKGVMLGAAVVNDIFGNTPANETGRSFLNHNSTLVDDKLKELSKDDRFCYYISVAIHTRANFSKATARDIIWWAKLDGLGILKKVSLPKSIGNYFQVAHEYLEMVMQNR